MEYLVSSEEMKRYDSYTSEGLGIPGAVLMERASLGLADVIEDCVDTEYGGVCRLVFICGFGNNGADGICCARILKEKNIESEVVLVGNPQKATELNLLQQKIFKEFGGEIKTMSITEAAGYIADMKGVPLIAVDALFGVGLTRPLAPEYEVICGAVNDRAQIVVAVDIPSGISADSGRTDGPFIKANITVTFGFRKLAHVLYPAAGYCGDVKLIEMGITPKSITGEKPLYKAITCLDDFKLPTSVPGANKGTYKKLLLIAGSGEVYGAAFLAAKAALACGIGMLMIITHEKNRLVLEQTIPEAIYRFYDDDTDEKALKELFDKAEKWADGILMGPGLGLGRTGTLLTGYTVKASGKPLVADADSIRIIAGDNELSECMKGNCGRKVILTPHLAEFAALVHLTVPEVREGLPGLPKSEADKLHAVINCKDAASIIASGDERESMINCTGNDGMASGGSGDVLSGITAVLLLQMDDPFGAAAMAAYLHGLAGDRARRRVGRRAMTASDIIDELYGLWEENDHEA